MQKNAINFSTMSESTLRNRRVVQENGPKSAVDHERIGFTAVIAKDLIGEVDNSAYPAIRVKDRGGAISGTWFTNHSVTLST